MSKSAHTWICSKKTRKSEGRCLSSSRWSYFSFIRPTWNVIVGFIVYCGTWRCWCWRWGCDLFFIFDLAPWQLTVDELDEHIVEGPEIIVATHLLVLVGVYGGVANRAAKPGDRSWHSNLAGVCRELTRQSKVQHVHVTVVVWMSPHRKIWLQIFNS